MMLFLDLRVSVNRLGVLFFLGLWGERDETDEWDERKNAVSV